MKDDRIKIFADMQTLDGKALAQFYDAMSCHFVTRGALMPDAHAGYSLPIGAVVATHGHIVPSWVGYDIGCGMCAMQTSFDKIDVQDHAEDIFRMIYDTIPVGFKINGTFNLVSDKAKSFVSETMGGSPLSDKAVHDIVEKKNWKHALGSLGGGNHFIEIGYDDDDKVWIVIHSGSRGVGHGIASHYMKVASNSQKAKEGHYSLRFYSKEGQKYFMDMNWALEFALANRMEMMERVLNAVRSFCDEGKVERDFHEVINRNHNHAVERYMDGEHVIIHRKGATHAEAGMYGVIPGNMRDGSFIVRGKGNSDALFSSSHGAGRVLGRKQAKKDLDAQSFKSDMERHGIIARTDEGVLDESPDAYKDIFSVMEMQKELVDVVKRIRPLINVKG
ncbi:MAG: RtcB family protein [Methanobacteriota archaeon]|nr:MAG: RtcB family protein [Euryarchaeota archaeon]